MILFGALFLLFIIAVFGIAAFIAALPLIGSLFLSIIGIRLKAPKWWFILTIIAGVCFSILNIADIVSENLDFLPLPLIIFGIYALVAIIILLCSRPKRAKEMPCDSMADSTFSDDDADCETALDELVATRYIEILDDSIRLLDTTTDPCTFFGRYNDALSITDKIISSSHPDSRVEYVKRKRAYLIDSKDRISMAFVDRCREKGTLWTIQNELLSDTSVLSPTVKQYVRSSLEQLMANAPQLPEGDKYIYCSVIFSEGGKSYYYKTNDASLSCGDEVIVPTENDGTKKSVGKITKIEYVSPEEAPYPPDMTKDILGKCNFYADEREMPEDE